MSRRGNDIEMVEADPIRWREVFNRFDTNDSGTICLAEMRTMLQSANYEHDLPDNMFRKMIDLTDRNRDGELNFEEFYKLVQAGAIPQGVMYRLLNTYVHTLVPRRYEPGVTYPDGKYEEHYTCFPPPIALFIICLIEVILFTYDLSVTGSSYSVNGPIANVLIYDPHRRYEAWRFFTYMFVHVGWQHIAMNILVLLILGIPLEMVHKWWRVLIVYFTGVIAGSLGTSIVDPTVYLAGASGGVYAIITAHLATIIMNWSEMAFPVVQLLFFAILMSADFGNAIYQRFIAKVETQIGYMAHLAGAISGLLVGIYILKNIEVHSWEKKLWWASLALFILLIAICIIWNVAFPEYFPPPNYN